MRNQVSDFWGLMSSVCKHAAEGKNTSQIAKLTGESRSRIAYLLEMNDTWVSNNEQDGTAKSRAIQNWPQVDMLSTGKYSLRRVAERVWLPKERKHPSYETVRKYLIRKGRYDAFLHDRHAHSHQSRAESRRDYGSLLSLLEKHLEERLSKASWAVQEAVKYDFRRPLNSNNIPLENVFRLLEAYEDVQDSGARPSYGQLGNMSGIRRETVRNILKSLKLKGFRGRNITPEKKKMAILRAYKTKYPRFDIAYFLDVPAYLVCSNMKFKFGDTGDHENFVGHFGNADNPETLSYRAASQIYQAQDWGWNEDDIAYCFDEKQRMVRYAIENRRVIGRKITILLDVLYPDVKHDKPYLEKAA